MSTSIDLASVDSGFFQPHVDSSLTLKTSEASIPGKLLSVSDIPTAMTSGRKPFSLIIQVETAELPQGTYELAHPTLGTLSIFLVPINLREGKLELEAVFA
jgi:hypothetical protein